MTTYLVTAAYFTIGTFFFGLAVLLIVDVFKLPSGARPVGNALRPGPVPSPADTRDRACSSPRTPGHDNYLGDLNCVDGEWMVSRPAVDFDAAVQRFGSPEWPEPESFASATHTVRRVDRLSRYTDRTIA